MDFQYPEGECHLQVISGLISRGLWAEAGAAAVAATQRVPATAEFYTLRGIVADKLGETDTAEAFFDTAQAVRPFEDWVVKNSAVHDLVAGKPDVAAARLRKAALFIQGDPQIQTLLEQAAKKEKLSFTAEHNPFFMEFIEKRKFKWRYIFEQKIADIDQAANEVVLGMVRNARLSEAAEWLSRFVEIQDWNPGLFYDLAKLYDISGRPRDALRAAWTAIELKPDFRDAYDLIANVFFQARYFTLSQTYYEKAANMSPRDPWAHYNLACAYQAGAAYGPAETEWRTAIQLEEEEVRLSIPGVPRKEDLDVALSVKPDSVSYQSYFGLGGMFVQLDCLEEARLAFLRASDIKPRAPEPHFELGRLALRKNDFPEAERHFKDYGDRGGDKSKIPVFKK